jgi:two-component system, NtrC family, response regulator AlgB
LAEKDLGQEVQPLSILVVDDEANIRMTLSMCLEAEGYRIVAVSNFQDALQEASKAPFDLAFLDLRLGTDDGLDLIPHLLTAAPWIKIIVITAYASVDTAVEAMKRGATDYIAKPFTPAQVRMAVRKAFEMRTLEQQVAVLQEDLERSRPEIDFSSRSQAMQNAINLARRAASSNATILLRGESGTGKTVLARSIHSWSNRADKPFGVVSCPSFSLELLESELFGHVKGAFTGAVRGNPGRISSCENGTLFLDEIGDLPLSLQSKLLRFVQEREYERVGDYITRKANVRIIAATNVDLEQAVNDRRFREDLFYRLNVIEIEIPPLRERPDDIAALAERLLVFYGKANHRLSLSFTDEALKLLKQYYWPGNVRELNNVIERTAILCQSNRVGIESLPVNLIPDNTATSIGEHIALDKIEEQHIRRVLATAKSLQEAAGILGIDQATLWRRRKKYGI